jgi:hypothetical protein
MCWVPSQYLRSTERRSSSEPSRAELGTGVNLSVKGPSSARGSAEPPSSSASFGEASGRAERKRVREGLTHSATYSVSLPSSHTSGSGGATCKLAPVVRFQRTLYSGTTTANGSIPSPFRGRARGHRELNRRDNPRGRSKVGLKAPARSVDGKRKSGRAHARGRGAQSRFGKAPSSRSDRPPQGGRERVGRGSLLRSNTESCASGVPAPIETPPAQPDRGSGPSQLSTMPRSTLTLISPSCCSTSSPPGRQPEIHDHPCAVQFQTGVMPLSGLKFIQMSTIVSVSRTPHRGSERG